MAALNIDDLLEKMLGAVKTSLGASWPAISALATTSIKALAQNFIDIEKMLADGQINQSQAVLLTDMQKNALQTVLLSEEGLGLLAVEAAINAAIGVVKDVVNAAIGIALL